MKKVLVMICALLSFGANAQEKSSKPKVSLSGFIRNDFVYDSRQNYEALDGGYTLLPKPIEREKDADGNEISGGKDINAQGSVRLLNASSRLRAKTTEVDLWGGTISGLMEVDAAARASDGTYHLRLRHAYIKMNWDRTSVLFGQAWHPMFVESCYPIVVNLNTGVPFQPFSRTPQLRVTHKLNDNFTVLGAASYQGQYENYGPDGPDSKYQRQAIVPNLDVQLSYNTKGFTMGVGYDYKMVKPYLSTTGTEGTFVSDETLGSHSYIAYITAKAGAWSLRSKAVLGQNMSDQLLPGGYAAYEVDPNTGAEKFTNSNIATGFIQPSWHKDNWTIGVMGGYMKNLGFDKDIVKNENPNEKESKYIYARTANLDQAWRTSCNIAYQIKGLKIMLEHELTSASYGNIDYDNKGKVYDAEEVKNHRVSLSTCYFF